MPISLLYFVNQNKIMPGVQRVPKSKFGANRFRGSRAMIGHTHKQTNYFIHEERLLRKKG